MKDYGSRVQALKDISIYIRHEKSKNDHMCDKQYISARHLETKEITLLNKQLKY